MGLKVHPYGFRVGINKPWHSRWFAGKDYSRLLIEDVHLRELAFGSGYMLTGRSGPGGPAAGRL